MTFVLQSVARRGAVPTQVAGRLTSGGLALAIARVGRQRHEIGRPAPLRAPNA
jgi:hypothetical protein